MRKLFYTIPGTNRALIPFNKETKIDHNLYECTLWEKGRNIRIYHFNLKKA